VIRAVLADCRDLNMPFARLVFSLALPAAVAAVPAVAQEVVTEKALSLDMAHAIAQGALRSAGPTGTTSA